MEMMAPNQNIMDVVDGGDRFMPNLVDYRPAPQPSQDSGDYER
jgi:hypothetical protein